MCEEESANLKGCSGCLKTKYCSKQCQKAAWRLHVFDCDPKKHISTVYYLSRACYENVVPQHVDTRTDYGFSKAHQLEGGQGEKMLLGLWVTIIVNHRVSEREVQRWQVQGRLIEGIEETFERIVPSLQGPYYTWFLLHQHLLDGQPLSQVERDRRIDVAEDILLRTWRFIGGSPNDQRDSIWSQVESSSPYIQRCFNFYESLLGDKDPAPMSPETWMALGFVAMPRRGVQELVGLYKQLIQRCTFSAFYLAYYDGSLPQLFAQHGLDIDISGATAEVTTHHGDASRAVSLFRDVMSGSPHLFKSVWILKTYVDELLYVDTPESHEVPHRAIRSDYGFSNCKTPAERDLLVKLYKKYFTHQDASVLDLHSACVKGELMAYLSKFVKMKPKTKTYQRLLKNGYPNPEPEPGANALAEYAGDLRILLLLLTRHHS